MMEADTPIIVHREGSEADAERRRMAEIIEFLSEPKFDPKIFEVIQGLEDVISRHADERRERFERFCDALRT